MYLTLGQEPTTTSLPFFSMHFPFVSQHVYFAALYSKFFSLQLSKELAQTFHVPLEQLRHQEVLEELSLAVLELTRLQDFLRRQRTRWELLKGTQSHNSALGRKSVSLDALQGPQELWDFFEFITLVSAPKWQGVHILFGKKQSVPRLLHSNTYTGIFFFSLRLAKW